MTRAKIKRFGLFCLAGIVVVFFFSCVKAPSATTYESVDPNEKSTTIRSKMVRFEGGTFIMGCLDSELRCYDDARPAHPVTLPSFRMDATEVTNDQYQHCVTAGACTPIDYDHCGGLDIDNVEERKRLTAGFTGVDHPAVCVTWDQAAAFCRWEGKRLPTEAEWEYAARKGFYNEVPEDLGNYAWIEENSGGTTHPVAQKQPDALSLYDMLGNAAEWCSDWWGSTYYTYSPSDNSTGPEIGVDRVIRGHSWRTLDEDVDITWRFGMMPFEGDQSISFRCAASE